MAGRGSGPNRVHGGRGTPSVDCQREIDGGAPSASGIDGTTTGAWAGTGRRKREKERGRGREGEGEERKRKNESNTRKKRKGERRVAWCLGGGSRASSSHQRAIWDSSGPKLGVRRSPRTEKQFTPGRARRRARGARTRGEGAWGPVV